MSGGFFPRRVRFWRDMVMVYDLGRGRDPRPFLKLDKQEQGFVVARTAWLQFFKPKEKQGSGVSSATRGVSSAAQSEGQDSDKSSDASRAPATAQGDAR